MARHCTHIQTAQLRCMTPCAEEESPWKDPVARVQQLLAGSRDAAGWDAGDSIDSDGAAESDADRTNVVSYDDEVCLHLVPRSQL
jgi:hypothetical protein